MSPRGAGARAAAAERDRVIRVAQREMQVVQHHDDRLGAAARQRGHRVERGDLLAEVEMRRRLVQQQQRRILREERGQREAPPLAPGQRARVARVEAGETECRERVRARVDIRRRFPLPAREVRMAADERGLQHRRREESRRCPAAGSPRRRARSRRPRAASGVPSYAISPAAGGREPGERRDERRLARAVRPDDDPALAGAHVEVEPGDERAARDRQRETPARQPGRFVRHERPRVQQREEHRDADERGDHPDGQLDRRGDRCAPACPRARSSAPPASALAGQQQALIVADHEPQRMRDDETDEARRCRRS